ncbi:hypothetical protein CCACVL1_03130, partial [Corchorus capsularis]
MGIGSDTSGKDSSGFLKFTTSP